jgi:hypothetical protein
MMVALFYCESALTDLLVNPTDFTDPIVRTCHGLSCSGIRYEGNGRHGLVRALLQGRVVFAAFALALACGHKRRILLEGCPPDRGMRRAAFAPTSRIVQTWILSMRDEMPGYHALRSKLIHHRRIKGEGVGFFVDG